MKKLHALYFLAMLLIIVMATILTVCPKEGTFWGELIGSPHNFDFVYFLCALVVITSFSRFFRFLREEVSYYALWILGIGIMGGYFLLFLIFKISSGFSYKITMFTFGETIFLIDIIFRVLLEEIKKIEEIEKSFVQGTAQFFHI